MHRVYLPDGRSFPGVTNVGTRPTVSESDTVSVETFILDFDGDLYGKFIQVELLHFLRPERQYADSELLRQAIADDITHTREYFAASQSE